MFTKTKKINKIFSSPKILRFLFTIPDTGYLKQIGWIQSYETKSSVDVNNNPLPWVTYSFIEFIKSKLMGLIIFEYGSGNSSYFYTNFCKQLVSVEHDKSWYEKISQHVPSKMNLT